MGRLEDSLQMGRISLRERQLLAESVERDAPGEDAPGPGDLDQPVQAPGDRGRQGQVARHAQRTPCGARPGSGGRSGEMTTRASPGSAATTAGNRAS